MAISKIIYTHTHVFSANAILNVFIPLRGHDLGTTNTTIGIVMGAYMLTAMVFRPWAGQIIARVGPIKVLRIILLINACALILYGLTGLEGYFIARVMQGVCTAFFSMSLQLGIIDALPEEHRSEGVSLYSLFSTIPNLVGPLIAVGIWHFRSHINICYSDDCDCLNNDILRLPCHLC